MVIPAHNVTIDPSTLASAVSNPEISEVLDLVAGDILKSVDFISAHRYPALVEKRGRILEAMKSSKPVYACAICHTPVYLVSSPEKRFFFRHRSEDGFCPAQTRGSLSQSDIRALKYHGLRESEAHKKIKRLIFRSLAADPRFDQESIVQEQRLRSQNDPDKWRQPDVQAISEETRFAFEAQLSTTFLDVVVSRRLFYRENDALLVWILREFSPNHRRLMIDDLLFSNNSNILVVDEETVRLSEEKREFYLRCHFRSLRREADRIIEDWDQRVVSFHDLVRNIDKQQLYLFDHDGERARLLTEIDNEIRSAFFNLCDTVEFPYDPRPEAIRVWQALVARLAGRDVAIPETPHADKSFRALLMSLLSVKKGAPFGWEFKALIEVAHHIAENYPQHLLAFGYALEHYDRRQLIESQDTSGKWKQKCDRFRPHIKAYDTTYLPDQNWLPTLTFLFPEIGHRLHDFVLRAAKANTPSRSN